MEIDTYGMMITYGMVDQTLDHDFNRGALFNIATKEALKMKEWDFKLEVRLNYKTFTDLMFPNYFDFIFWVEICHNR